MLRRPAKDAPKRSWKARAIENSPAKASQEIEDLALKLNTMGSKEGAEMLLQSEGAEFIFEDDFVHLRVYGVNGERLCVCKWFGGSVKYLTNSDLQDGQHSWIVATVRRKLQ